MTPPTEMAKLNMYTQKETIKRKEIENTVPDINPMKQIIWKNNPQLMRGFLPKEFTTKGDMAAPRKLQSPEVKKITYKSGQNFCTFDVSNLFKNVGRIHY